MPIKLKGRVYKTVIRPVMMCGSESWPVRTSDVKKMEVAEIKMPRWKCPGGAW